MYFLLERLKPVGFLILLNWILQAMGLSLVTYFYKSNAFSLDKISDIHSDYSQIYAFLSGIIALFIYTPASSSFNFTHLTSRLTTLIRKLFFVRVKPGPASPALNSFKKWVTAMQRSMVFFSLWVIFGLILGFYRYDGWWFGFDIIKPLLIIVTLLCELSLFIFSDKKLKPSLALFEFFIKVFLWIILKNIQYQFGLAATLSSVLIFILTYLLSQRHQFLEAVGYQIGLIVSISVLYSLPWYGSDGIQNEGSTGILVIHTVQDLAEHPWYHYFNGGSGGPLTSLCFIGLLFFILVFLLRMRK